MLLFRSICGRSRIRKAKVRFFVASDDEHMEGKTKSPITDALWRQRRQEREMYEAHGDLTALPPHIDLQTKAPRDSAVRIEMDFSGDPALRDRYTNCWGAIDKGIVFEDLDALAGNVAWRHAVVGNGTDVRPPMLVTAAVDEVRLRGSLRPDSNVYMRGRVIFVGSSSMLVRCEVGHARGSGPSVRYFEDTDDKPLLSAEFLYVARDRVTHKASKVNRLVCGSSIAPSGSPDSTEDALDLALFAEKQRAAEAQKQARLIDAESRLALDNAVKREARQLLAKSQSLIRMPCLPAARVASVLIENTKLQNTMICQPQQRNTSGRIFGGFLMRRAYELAVATAYCFSGRSPLFLWSDEISFNAPVSIGDVLRLDAYVVATEPDRERPRIHCEVFASVLQPEDCNSALSNRFAFTFCIDSQSTADSSLPVIPTVLPSITSEAIKQLEILDASSKIPDWEGPPTPTSIR